MPVLRRLAVLAQRTNRRCDVAVVRDERAAVTRGTEVLARIETESGCMARPGAVSLTLGSVRLARVLEDPNGVTFGEIAECFHVGELPVDVQGHGRVRAVADRRLGSRWIEAVVVGRDVGHDRN